MNVVSFWNRVAILFIHLNFLSIYLHSRCSRFTLLLLIRRRLSFFWELIFVVVLLLVCLFLLLFVFGCLLRGLLGFGSGFDGCSSFFAMGLSLLDLKALFSSLYRFHPWFFPRLLITFRRIHLLVLGFFLPLDQTSFGLFLINYLALRLILYFILFY